MGNIGFVEAVLEMGEAQAAARTLGLEVSPLDIRRAEDISPAFEALKAQADALYVAQDALVAANRLASLRWRSVRACRQSSVLATLSKLGL